MKSVHFLGNPSSPHVRHWEMLLNANGVTPVVHGIGRHLGHQVLVQSARALGPAWSKRLPAPMAYVLAGLWLRRQRRTGGTSAPAFFHAHNTSGYGLTAWLSGVPYGVTTYGTEIFGASRRSPLYRHLIKKVLNSAAFITSASPQMTRTLTSELLVDPEKIHEFYLGVSPLFQFSEQSRHHRRQALGIPADATAWIVNRRMHSHYHTLEVVRAFNRFAGARADGHLILIQGDADPEYARLVSQEARGHPRIHVIQGFLAQEALRDWLCAADFAISVPRSDQLSSSILEAMQCGAIPVLGRLPSYQSVGAAAEWVDISPGRIEENLTKMFVQTAGYAPERLKAGRDDTWQKIKEINNPERIGAAIQRLYPDP